MTDHDDDAVIYLAYGEVMHQLQVFELSLWRPLTEDFGSDMTLDQMVAEVDRWSRMTLGQLTRELKRHGHGPDTLTPDLDRVLKDRNYLAHHFLRECFVLVPSVAARDAALAQLAEVREAVVGLGEAVDAHLCELGAPSPEGLTEKEWAETERLRPTEWPLGPPPQE